MGENDRVLSAID